MSGYANNSIFWIETAKIQPNPFQPRKEFEPNALEDLADSLRQYGVLQPLVVTRNESYRNDGGMEVSYELIAGERRLRAAKIAGLQQVPVIIRKETDNKVKLELAIIENLQREDLNPIDRALAFEQLYKEFNLTHAEIGKRMGKSRVYVSNSLRLLALPDDIKKALMEGKITEGHTRPLLMLVDRPEEQNTLFKEIMVKNMSVRDAEKIARKVAQDKVRKKEFEVDPKIRVYEEKMSENLGTRVHIEPKEKGGKIVIDYFTLKDLDTILASIKKAENKDSSRMMEAFIEQQRHAPAQQSETSAQQSNLSDSTPVSFKEEEQQPTSQFNKQEAPVQQEVHNETQEEVKPHYDYDAMVAAENSRNQEQEEQVAEQTQEIDPPLIQQQVTEEPEKVSDFLTGNPYQNREEEQKLAQANQSVIESKNQVPIESTPTASYEQTPVPAPDHYDSPAQDPYMEDISEEDTHSKFQQPPQASSYREMTPLNREVQQESYQAQNMNSVMTPQNQAPAQTQDLSYEEFKRTQAQQPPQDQYNQQNVYQQQAPEKKGFLGKIFG